MRKVRGNDKLFNPRKPRNISLIAKVITTSGYIYIYI
jgi:hypothetical protein